METMGRSEMTFLTADIHVQWSWLYDTSQNLQEMFLVQSVEKIVAINAFSPNFDKQDSHCTYYVTLRSIRLTILAVENQYILHIQSVCF